MSEFQTAIDIAQIVAAGSAGIAAAMALVQSRITQKQFASSTRPWIAIISNGIDIANNGKVTVTLKNYGKSPAFNLKVWFGFQTEQFQKENVKELKQHESESAISLFPDSERETTNIIPEYQKVIDEGLTVHILLVVEYSYDKSKKGEYILIGHFTPETEEQDVTYESGD